MLQASDCKRKLRQAHPGSIVASGYTANTDIAIVRHLPCCLHVCIPVNLIADVTGNVLRQTGDLSLHTIRSFEDAKALEGQEIGLSDWSVVDQKCIDQFAEATGDFQWIHVDTARAAKELPEGKTIAHGYLTLSLIPALTQQFVSFENLARAINFGCNKVRFYTMVPVGSRVRARATIVQARQRAGALHLSSEVRVEVEGERKPACVAETLGMYFFDSPEGEQTTPKS